MSHCRTRGTNEYGWFLMSLGNAKSHKTSRALIYIHICFKSFMLSKKHGHRRRTRARAKHGMTDAELVEFIYQGSNIFVHYIPFQQPLRVWKCIIAPPKWCAFYYSFLRILHPHQSPQQHRILHRHTVHDP